MEEPEGNVIAMLAYSTRSRGLVDRVVARQPVCARTIATLRLGQRSSRFPSFVLGRRSSSHSKKMSSTSKDASPGWIAWYSSKLDTHPLLVKGISSGLIASAGDFLCQFFIEQHSYDILRTVRFTILGTFVVTPFVHTWFGFLNKTFPGVSAAAISKRVVTDQLAFSPCFLSVRQDVVVVVATVSFAVILENQTTASVSHM